MVKIWASVGITQETKHKLDKIKYWLESNASELVGGAVITYDDLIEHLIEAGLPVLRKHLT